MKWVNLNIRCTTSFQYIQELLRLCTWQVRKNSTSNYTALGHVPLGAWLNRFSYSTHPLGKKENLCKELYGILGKDNVWPMDTKKGTNVSNVTQFKCYICNTPVLQCISYMNADTFKGVTQETEPIWAMSHCSNVSLVAPLTLVRGLYSNQKFIF